MDVVKAIVGWGDPLLLYSLCVTIVIFININSNPDGGGSIAPAAAAPVAFEADFDVVRVWVGDCAMPWTSYLCGFLQRQTECGSSSDYNILSLNKQMEKWILILMEPQYFHFNVY